MAIGPGLGRSPWALALLTAVLGADLPVLVDADGLNLLASDESLSDYHREEWVLTPPPGEAARLLSKSTGDIQANRFEAVKELQETRGGVVALKGAGSLVASRHQIGLCRAGNPGMATGGMGDVLSGVIAALIAQGLALAEAANLGVLIHAMAGDRAAAGGERGMLATDLMPHLRKLVNGL